MDTAGPATAQSIRACVHKHYPLVVIWSTWAGTPRLLKPYARLGTQIRRYASDTRIIINSEMLEEVGISKGETVALRGIADHMVLGEKENFERILAQANKVFEGKSLLKSQASPVQTTLPSASIVS